MTDEAREPEFQKNPITANELARLIRRLAKLFDSGDLGNIETSDALIALADHLQSLGSIAIKDLEAPGRPKKKAHLLDNEAVRKASIDQVREMLSADLSKTQLVQLARVRFGMPEARLRRMPTEQVIEAIRATAAHEESLDIIDRNAELSGRTRSS